LLRASVNLRHPGPPQAAPASPLTPSAVSPRPEAVPASTPVQMPRTPHPHCHPRSRHPSGAGRGHFGLRRVRSGLSPQAAAPNVLLVPKSASRLQAAFVLITRDVAEVPEAVLEPSSFW